nr:immunoglobulin light chain junction region [Homo sapiens]
LHARCTRSS